MHGVTNYDYDAVHSLFTETSERADKLQRALVENARNLGYVKHVVSSLQPYFENTVMNPKVPAEQWQFLHSGMSNVAEINNSLIGVERMGITAGTSFLALSASTFAASSTASSQLFTLSPPLDLAFAQIPSTEVRAAVAGKLAKVSADLDKVYLQVWDNLLATTSEPERAAAVLMRQTWDHFFSALAPEDQVRASATFLGRKLIEDETSEKRKVTRNDRVIFALEAKRTGDSRWSIVAASADEMIRHYRTLNRFHAREPIKPQVMRAAIVAIASWIQEWTELLFPESR